LAQHQFDSVKTKSLLLPFVKGMQIPDDTISCPRFSPFLPGGFSIMTDFGKIPTHLPELNPE
jgi:hypothetical protein